MIAPMRNLSLTLSRTVKSTVPLPVPLPLLIVIQLSLVVAIQFTPAGAEICKKDCAPAAAKAPLFGEKVVSAMSAPAFTFNLPLPNSLLGEPLLPHTNDEM